MNKPKTKPVWLNPERQAELIRLFVQSNGFCIHGFTPCKGKWQRQVKVVCARFGKDFVCLSPVKIGEPCRYKPEQGKPVLPCDRRHVIKLNWRCDYGDYACYSASFIDNENLLTFGVKGECQYPEYVSRLIQEWRNDSRSLKQAEWQAERLTLHALGERREPIRGRFNGVSREITLAEQPTYYLDSLGVSGLTFKPFAKIRLSSSYVYLYVDIQKPLQAVSKSKKRKAIRYGKPLPAEILDRIDLACNKAVRHYLKR